MSWVKIASSTVSSVSSISFDNCFPSPYVHFMIRQRLTAPTADYRIDVRLRSSGTDDSGANYQQQFIVFDGNVISAVRNTSETAFVAAAGYTTTGDAGFQDLKIDYPNIAGRAAAFCANLRTPNTPANMDLFLRTFNHTTGSTFDGFTMIVDTTTVSGTVTVYGLENA